MGSAGEVGAGRAARVRRQAMRRQARWEAERAQDDAAESQEPDVGLEPDEGAPERPTHASEGKRSKVRKATPPAQYCTGKEIAELLRVHVKTVERWRVKLGLPCLRMGGTVRYELSDVCDWASARKEG